MFIYNNLYTPFVALFLLASNKNSEWILGAMQLHFNHKLYPKEKPISVESELFRHVVI